MPSPEAVYPAVLRLIEALGGPPHAAARGALTRLVTALLCSQRLTATALMRALTSALPVPARQRYKRVARALARDWLTPAWLTPRLVRAALALVPDPVPHLALDTVRLGRWEVFTVGVVWHGRVLPVGWAVLPYPLPKGSFTPTTCALLRALAAAWPADRAAPHLVADRGFPSQALFRTLHQLGWGFSIRLRAKDTVRVDGQIWRLRHLIETVAEGTWVVVPATYGGGAQAVAGTLVIGRGLSVTAPHQANPASRRAWARQQAARRKDLSAAAQQTDPWMLLFTTHRHERPALRSYRRRWATEGSYRDGQSGWDGRHGWDLDRAVARLTEARAVARVVGLWALGTLVQSVVGDAVGRPDAPTTVRAVRAEWTTTGRLSVWARGHLALSDRSGRLHGFLLDALRAAATQIAAAPPLATAAPAALPDRPSLQEAA
jgi:hypothetical protein